MEILVIDFIVLSKLRNAEHVQFHSNARDIVNSVGVSAMGMAPAVLSPYVQAITKEQDIVNRTVASAYTKEMEDADKKRISMFRRVRRKLELVNLAEPDETVLISAQNVVNAALLGKYPSTTVNLAYQEKTSTITGFIQDCRNLLTGDQVEAIGIDGDLDTLEAYNQGFAKLYQERISERALNPVISNELREATDEAYRLMVVTLNGLANQVDAAKKEQIEAARECVSLINQVVKEAKAVLNGRLNGVSYVIDEVRFADPDQQLPALMSQLDFVQVIGQKLKGEEVKLGVTIQSPGKAARSVKMSFREFADTYHAVLSEQTDPDTNVTTLDMDRWMLGEEEVTLNFVE